MYLLIKAVYLTFPLTKIENIWSDYHKYVGATTNAQLWKKCFTAAYTNYFWPTGHFTKTWQFAGQF